MRAETPPEIPNNTAVVLKNANPEKFCQQPPICGFLCINLRIYATVFQETRVSNFNLLILSRSDLVHGRDNSQLPSEIFECFPGIYERRKIGQCSYVFKCHPTFVA